MSGLVIVDSHINLATSSLYGQSPLVTPSSLGTSSTPWVEGMSDDEFTPKRFNTLSMNAFRVTSNAPNSLSYLKAQTVYQVSSPSYVVGNFTTNAAWKYLHVSFEDEITISST